MSAANTGQVHLILLRARLALFCLLISTSVCASPPAEPLSLSLPAGTLGIFDPSLEGAPDGSRLWMSYSGASLSGLAGLDPISIGTRLAYSTDHGAEWH